MVNYQLGKIYKIYSHIDPSICYVGSTCKKLLCQRMNGHRSDYKVWKNGNGRKITSYDLFDKFGIENCIIELIEEYQCDSKDQLSKKEGEYIKLLNCINKNIAGRTNNEWHHDNKVQIAINTKEYKKNYEIENKEVISLRKKKYYEQNKERLLLQTQEYKNNNKAKIAKRQKEYDNINKEKIAIKKKEYHEKQKLKKLIEQTENIIV